MAAAIYQWYYYFGPKLWPKTDESVVIGSSTAAPATVTTVPQLPAKAWLLPVELELFFFSQLCQAPEVRKIMVLPKEAPVCFVCTF